MLPDNRSNANSRNNAASIKNHKRGDFEVFFGLSNATMILDFGHLSALLITRNGFSQWLTNVQRRFRNEIKKILKTAFVN